MKTERRHELQKKDLVGWIQENFHYVQTHATTIVITIVGVILIIAIVTGVSQWGSSHGELEWQEYYRAVDSGDVGELMEVARKHKDTLAGLWAQQMAADIQLGNASGLAFRDRESSLKEAGSAKTKYEEICKATDNPLLERRALFGLAKSYEVLLNPKKAEETYRELAAMGVDEGEEPKGTFGKEAKRRADFLANNIEWYAWFKTVDPKTYRPKPNPLTRPRQPYPITPRPNTTLPDLGSPFLPGTGSGTPDTGVDTTVPIPGGIPLDGPASGTGSDFETEFGQPEKPVTE